MELKIKRAHDLPKDLQASLPSSQEIEQKLSEFFADESNSKLTIKNHQAW